MMKKKIDVSLLATTTTTLLFVVFLYSSSSNTAQAATYIVGDSRGWTFNVSGWENGKNFLEGDKLIFNYPPGLHNVLSVDKFNYDSCTVPAGAKPLFNDSAATPNDVNIVSLTINTNYFICGIHRHCAKGMRIAPVAE